MVEFALSANGSSVRENNMLGDREPQSGPSRFTGASFIDSIKPFEQSRKVLGRNSWPEISNEEFKKVWATRPQIKALFIRSGRMDPYEHVRSLLPEDATLDALVPCGFQVSDPNLTDVHQYPTESSRSHPAEVPRR